ncbi:hypothetical protein R3P38DRAFT_3187309 [Favolaschia claudopus]|uniref:Uncharacterized protein n=1 Tax=Favolaschia claudopus TaxID=2862362 RepID=A0AAW0BYU0_9AGAR
MHRAGGYALSVKTKELKRINTILVPHRRWEHTKLDHISKWPRIFEAPTPQLRSLDISAYAAYPLSENSSIPFTLQDAALLRNIALPKLGSVLPALLWAQLTSLNGKLYAVSPHNYASILLNVPYIM